MVQCGYAPVVVWYSCGAIVCSTNNVCVAKPPLCTTNHVRGSFRESALTKLLMDSLGGNAKTLMVRAA